VLTSYYIIHAYLRDVGMHINNLQRSVNDMEELVAIHDEAIGIVDVSDARPIDIQGGRIVFDDVTFHYGGHREPLYDRLSVDIRAGERVGLVGRSGSGKTTFVKLVQRLYDVTGGRILIDGQDIAKVQQASLRAEIGIVPQDTVLFNDTIGYNIAYGRDGATHAQVEAAARGAAIHGFIASTPEQYATKVGERGLKLSGGEKQRVAIARTLLKNPPILILDEATSALDSRTEAEIQATLRAIAERRTTIVIAHRLSTIVDADEIVVLEAGMVVERGTHAALLAKNGLYAEMWARQQAEQDDAVAAE
jgi:ATP-binding cassette subfamily B protein